MIRLLHVEDESSDAQLVARFLAKFSPVRFEIRQVELLEAALQCAASEPFDVVLMDLGLADSVGLNTFLIFHRRMPQLPVVITSGQDEEQVAMQAMQEGAQDYLSKNEMSGLLLVRTLRYAIERQRAAEALRSSEERFRALLDNAYDGINISERTLEELPDGTRCTKRRLVFCNDRYVEMAGRSREELMAYENLSELTVSHLSPAERQANLDRLLKGLSGRGISSWKRPDGRENYYEWVSVPIWLGGKLHTIGIDRDITERRKMEEKLHETEERFQLLLQNTNDGIVFSERESARRPDGTLHLKRRLVFCNDRFVEMSGRSREELAACDDLNSLVVTLLSPAEQVEVCEKFLSGQPAGGVSCWKRPDGKENFFEWMTVPITYKGKLYTIGIDRDITERRKMEEKLHESEERFRLLLDNAYDGINLCLRVMDPSGGPTAFKRQLIFCNDRYVEMSGRSREELAAADDLNLLVVSRLSPEEEEFNSERLLKGQLRTGVASWKRPDGKENYYEWVSVPIEHRGKIFTLGIDRDITERRKMEQELIRARDQLELRVRERTDELAQANETLREEIVDRCRAEEALRKAEEKYRSIVENAVEGICQATVSGRFITVNPALVRMLGYSSAEELMSSITDMAKQLYVREADRAEILHTLEEKGLVQGFETQFYRKNRTKIWVSVSSRAIRNAEGRMFRLEATVVDVSARRQLEEELRQAHKMEAIGRLAGGVAHDFNNLLMAITGYTALLMERFSPDSPPHKELQEVKRAADRAGALTRQLLAFSRRQILQPKVINLNTVILDMEKMLQRLIGENIELETVPAVGLGHAKADPGQIEQVVMNLAINARDAMLHGGKLSIRTANELVREKIIQKPDVVPPGNYVTLTVSDTGHGMDRETQSHLFEPFFTTKERGKGTGMGLSTVYGIVQQSGGHIVLQSEPKQGSSFTIYLPRVEEQPAATAAPVAVKAPVRGTETVLLVEDEDMVRSLVSEVLQINGYKVHAARHGAEAIQIASDASLHIHLLLTDVIMPGLNGRQLADKLVVSRPDLKVLFMSGYTSSDIIGHGVLDATTNFLQKPFTPAVLVRKLREVLDHDPAAPRKPGA